MDTMKAIRAVVVVAAAAMCGTVWGAAPDGKAHNQAKPRAKAAVKKQVRKVPRAKAPVARRAGPNAQARTTRPAAPKVAARAKPPVAAARASAARAAVAPREPYWTPLPPSRFYPNGVPELRPEFLHPLPQQTSRQEAAANASQGTAEHADIKPSSGGL